MCCGRMDRRTEGQRQNSITPKHSLRGYNKGAKRNAPHLLQAQQASICLWSISETLQCQKFHGIVTKSTVSSRVCWSLKVLWGSVSADFRQFKVGGEGSQYREKIAQHMLRAIAVLHFLICALKSCPAPAALAAGAGHYFSLTAYIGWLVVLGLTTL